QSRRSIRLTPIRSTLGLSWRTARRGRIRAIRRPVPAPFCRSIAISVCAFALGCSDETELHPSGIGIVDATLPSEPLEDASADAGLDAGRPDARTGND